MNNVSVGFLDSLLQPAVHASLHSVVCPWTVIGVVAPKASGVNTSHPSGCEVILE